MKQLWAPWRVVLVTLVLVFGVGMVFTPARSRAEDRAGWDHWANRFTPVWIVSGVLAYIVQRRRVDKQKTAKQPSPVADRPAATTGAVATVPRVANAAAAGRGPLPDPATLTDPATRAAIARIWKHKAELEVAIAETPPQVIETLAVALDSAHEFHERAAKLAARAEDIARYLAGKDQPAMAAEIAQLEARIATTQDAVALAGFQEALASRRDELRSLGGLATAKDRIDADLMKVDALLGAMPTKVVVMRALDAEAMEKFSGDMSSEIETVTDQLKASEEAMRDVVEIART